MSFSINKAILLGNVTRDPELKTTKSGNYVLAINLATNHSVKQGDGSYVDVPTFHRVVVFSRIAEWLSKNVFKGTKIYVDGRISTREYTDKEGKKQRSREIIADNVIPMSSKQNTIPKNNTTTPVNAVESEKRSEDSQMPENDGKEDVSPDDIPF